MCVCVCVRVLPGVTTSEVTIPANIVKGGGCGGWGDGDGDCDCDGGVAGVGVADGGSALADPVFADGEL